MGLRDIVLLVTIYGSIPFIYIKPFIGVLVWYWLSLMNPHRISWSLTNQPFAQLVVLALLSSLLIARNEKKQIPATPITITLGVFWAWMLVTTIFSFYPQLAWWQWDKVWKIMLTTFIAIMVLNSKPRLLALVTVAAGSIGIWSFKGGLFTIVTGGGYRVYGPPGTFIGDNNAMALAIIMTLPLLAYLRRLAVYPGLKLFLLVTLVLSVFAALGSQSRGALLGLVSLAVFAALASKKKFQYLLFIAVLAPIAWNFMPETWHERMDTIRTYEQDASAMGRIYAWRMAVNLALDRPLGGGFETFRSAVYRIYLPEVGGRNTDAHSIWFEILGEQGFIGLFLFLLLGALVWFTCGRAVRASKRVPELMWAAGLGQAIRGSLAAYAITGTFLGLAYFDYLYLLVALAVGLNVVVGQELASRAPKQVGSNAAGSNAAGASDAQPPEPLPAPRVPFVPSAQQAWLELKQWYGRL
jgi:probable O-glycosylation ligase (exosortase A-associated)